MDGLSNMLLTATYYFFHNHLNSAKMYFCYKSIRLLTILICLNLFLSKQNCTRECIFVINTNSVLNII